MENFLSAKLAYSSVKIIINTSYHPKNYLSQNAATFGLLFKLL
jgi:hypothetical protein